MIRFYNLETEETMELDNEEVYAIIPQDGLLIIQATNEENYKAEKVSFI